MTHCTTLWHIATHCKHIATHCITLLHIATCEHIVSHCITFWHIASHCYALLHTAKQSDSRSQHLRKHTASNCDNCNTLLTHCNTFHILRHIATHCESIWFAFATSQSCSAEGGRAQIRRIIKKKQQRQTSHTLPDHNERWGAGVEYHFQEI